MFKKILVPVDGSDPSDAARDLAVWFAAESGASLQFVHAVDLTRIIVSGGPGIVDPTPLIEAANADGVALLAEAQAKADAMRVSAKAELLEDACVPSILQAAHRHRADLIIMGSHGRGGVSRLLLGSVTEGVMRCAKVPVLVCHGPAAAKAKATITHEARMAEATIM